MSEKVSLFEAVDTKPPLRRDDERP